MAKITHLLQQRQQQWTELTMLCHQLDKHPQQVGPEERVRFAQLYRAACADLALADRYQLPPRTREYVHQLVSLAHNQLYRSRRFEYHQWLHALLREVPSQVYHDRCVQFSLLLFWGLFALTGYLAWHESAWPHFASTILNDSYLESLEQNFAEPISAERAAMNPFMASYYFRHNTSIGLQCFAGGVLILPGITIEAYNAIVLGASFGHMLRPDIAAREHFIAFVTAHAPFELTAIGLAAGAGLRIGWGWIATGGLARGDSLRRAGRQSMPIMASAMVLFFLAGMTEAFISGSIVPYAVKRLVAVISGLILFGYFVLLGRRPLPE